MPTSDEPTPEEIRQALRVLEGVCAHPGSLAALEVEEAIRLQKAAGQITRPDAPARRKLRKERAKLAKVDAARETEEVLDRTGIRELRRRPVFTTPDYRLSAQAALSLEAPSPHRVDEAQNCYICKKDFHEIHSFYDQLCPDCAAFNFRKRTELADFRGRVSLVTGGRVKIGFQAAMKLLRCGSRVILTTRFPRDAAKRFAAEADFKDWGDRLSVFGLDLRHTPSVESFCSHLLATEKRLDFIVNNACQTVRRPPAFYRHMMELERAELDRLRPEEKGLLGSYEGLRQVEMLPHGQAVAASELSKDAGLRRAAELSQLELLENEGAEAASLFPAGRLDQDLQQIDLRDRNSWRFTLAEVPTVELLEVHLVNAVAPFILNARLKPLMMREPSRDKHIVNVSAMEGQFYRKAKTTRHPHTNMAKAALNMMTRTSAADYEADGIHMNAVDTGWVTDEDPAELAERKTERHRFHPPLDILDGAARIVDPMIDGVNTGKHVWGQFLKDYRPTDW